ncbi:MAG: flagellin [Candidatus Poribacteria bacterium]
MASIRTNLQASLISRQLSNINRRFSTNLERLSTGLRLNRPDDSPGTYGVVSFQRQQIQALGQGVINAQNAAGFLQTAEEGINSLIDILNRAFDLAVTAADATLTSGQRQQAQDEMSMLLTASDGSSELNQILKNVKYNGQRLLADSQQAAAIQNVSLGNVGGDREGDTVKGGDLTQLLYVKQGIADSGNTTIITARTGVAVNSLTSSLADIAFELLTTTGIGSLDNTGLIGLTNTGSTIVKESGLIIALSNNDTGDFTVGDTLELKLEDLDTGGNVTATYRDEVIVVDITAASMTGTSVANAASVTVINSAGFTTALNLISQKTIQTNGVSTNQAFTMSRIPTTFLVDSTGATIKTSNSFDFTPAEDAISIREVLHVGVKLQPTGETNTTAATINRVNLSFTGNDAVNISGKIQAAIESQLGGEYRSGGSLHIRVVPVVDVYKATVETIDFHTSGSVVNAFKVGSEAELTTDLYTRTTSAIGSGTNASLGALGTSLVKGAEFADLTKVRFKFVTDTSAGVQSTPEMRVMSDDLTGYDTSTTRTDNLFGNAMLSADGEHGNDKFMLTVDGEEVEVDLDIAGASSVNSVVGSFITQYESGSTYATDQTSGVHTKSVSVDIGRLGISMAAGIATETAGANYLVGGYSDRIYSGGYLSPDHMSNALQTAINSATQHAADVSVSYDKSSRTLTSTTTSRMNQSSLEVGKGVATTISIGTANLTSLIDTSKNSAGFVGALGFSQGASATGTGSDFQFRLGGSGDTYGITIDTLGLQNFGADNVDMSSLNISTQGGAGAAVSLIEKALESVSSTQVKIGASINHMSRRINVMESHREALVGAKARLEEIDFTEETRNLASLQILLQSSTAALAQANIIPQTLLQLLA